MNWTEVEGNWMQYKGKLTAHWGKLTDDDVKIVHGRRTELLGLLKKRYGHTQEQAEREIDLWTKQLQ